MSVDWVTYSNEEIEEIFKNFQKKENPQSEIGVTLRDQYGILVLKQ